MTHIGIFQKTPGTSLQPHTLAAFLPWGSFAGADRPTRRKGISFDRNKKGFS